MPEPDRSPPKPYRYAVVFRKRGGVEAAGSLELLPTRMLLVGRGREGGLELTVELADVAAVRIGRLPPDRLNGHRTLVLERAELPPVQVAPLEAGLLHEIAGLLEELTGEQQPPGDELTVVVPLKTGCLERARSLLALGPPLDPAELGLTGHRVYLREREALFVFTGANVSARLGNVMRAPALWRAGMAWRDCIAGRPRVRADTQMVGADEVPAFTWPPADNS